MPLKRLIFPPVLMLVHPATLTRILNQCNFACDKMSESWDSKDRPAGYGISCRALSQGIRTSEPVVLRPSRSACATRRFAQAGKRAGARQRRRRYAAPRKDARFAGPFFPACRYSGRSWAARRVIERPAKPIDGMGSDIARRLAKAYEPAARRKARDRALKRVLADGVEDHVDAAAGGKFRTAAAKSSRLGDHDMVAAGLLIASSALASLEVAPRTVAPSAFAQWQMILPDAARGGVDKDRFACPHLGDVMQQKPGAHSFEQKRRGASRRSMIRAGAREGRRASSLWKHRRQAARRRKRPGRRRGRSRRPDRRFRRRPPPPCRGRRREERDRSCPRRQ